MANFSSPRLSRDQIVLFPEKLDQIIPQDPVAALRGLIQATA